MKNSDIEMKELIEKNLRNNGFPQKTVSLPLEKLYEVADKKGVNLNTILDSYRSNGVSVTSNGDKIIFQANSGDKRSPLDGLDLSELNSMNKNELMEKYNELMKNITPDQLSEIKNMYEKMTPNEREEIMRKSKEMGII